MNPITILTTGDNHHGALLGLTPPRYWSDDNRAYAEPFWNLYVEKIKSVGYVDVHVRNGDLIDGTGRKDGAVMLTTDINKQVDMAVESGDVVDAGQTYIVRGTGFHTDIMGNGTCLEDFVAKELGVPIRDNLDLEVYGRGLNWRHVVGRSDVPYGQGTQIGKEIIREMLQSELEDFEAATALYRSHVHYSVKYELYDQVLGHFRIAMTCPCLELKDPIQSGFHRKLRTQYYHVGVTKTTVYPNGHIDNEVIGIPIRLTSPRYRERICITPSI